MKPIPRVLVTRPIPPTILAAFDGRADVIVRQGPEPPTRDELLQSLPAFDAVITMLTDPLDAAVLRAASLCGGRLRVLSQIAVGLDNVDVAGARACGITVCNTPGVLTDATADLCFALLLATCRRLPAARRQIVEGRWSTWELEGLCGLELRGARLGLLGYGRIGRAVAVRARAFGMEVLACNRSPWATDGDPAHARACGLAELLDGADVLSVHVPLLADTRHLVDEGVLRRLRRGAYLINTARGPIVDEAAVVRALDDGHLAGAGLDVFEDEPRIHPGLFRDEVVLTPHIGSATLVTRHRMATAAVEGVLRWIGQASG